MLKRVGRVAYLSVLGVVSLAILAAMLVFFVAGLANFVSWIAVVPFVMGAALIGGASWWLLTRGARLLRGLASQLQ